MEAHACGSTTGRTLTTSAPTNTGIPPAAGVSLPDASAAARSANIACVLRHTTFNGAASSVAA